MPHVSPGTETEIKLRVSSAAHARGLLRGAGFRLLRRRLFEDNIVFDTPRHNLRRSGALLRVREAGKTVLLTYKGPAEAGRHKTREELEIECAGADTLRRILERLEYHPAFRYQKYRTEYSDTGGHGIATIDETPIGVFLELEGAPAWIDATASKLGYSESDYVTASYARLYRDDCARRRIKPGDMTFERSGG
jgi:adenylate cyclase class 2